MPKLTKRTIKMMIATLCTLVVFVFTAMHFAKEHMTIEVDNTTSVIEVEDNKDSNETSVIKNVPIPNSILTETFKPNENKPDDNILSKNTTEQTVKTETLDRTQDPVLASQANIISSEIVSGLMDTISASTGTISKSVDGGKAKLYIEVEWNSQHQSIIKSVQKLFKATHIYNPISNDTVSSKITIYQDENTGTTELDSALEFLLDNELSLVAKAGKYETKLSIANGQRIKERLAYTLLTGSKYDPNQKINKADTNPIIIEDIPFDEFKNIRNITVDVELRRLDTGRTFRIELSSTPLNINSIQYK